MKKFFMILLLGTVALIFISTAVFLYNKSQQEPVVYETDTPFTATIVQKTVATSKVVPRKEVNVTSQVSGIVGLVYVTAWEIVAKRALISKITLCPVRCMTKN